jgi:hypothetical protein
MVIKHSTGAITMSTQNIRFDYQATSDRSSGLAIFFFLIGAPHVYIALRQQRHFKSRLRDKLLAPQSIGLLSLTIVGITAFFALP